jgi:uncharacterized protein (DUF3084 family)
MTNSDIDVGHNPTTKFRRHSTINRCFRTSRKAEILDTLVILIAGFLLPVWLLGHLFLARYPAPVAPVATADENLQNSQVEVSGELQSTPKVSAVRETDAKVDSDSDATQSENDSNLWQEKFESVSSEFKALTSQTGQIQSNNESLKKTNASLQAENKSLLAKLESLQSAKENSKPVQPADDKQTEKLAAANQKIAALLQKVDQLTKRSQDQAAQSQAATANLAQQEAALQAAQQAVESLAAQNKKLQVALSKENQKPNQNQKPKAQLSLGQQPGGEVFRKYISSRGNPAKMAFVRWEGDEIIFRNFADKKLYRLTLDRFSEADQRHLLDRK